MIPCLRRVFLLSFHLLVQPTFSAAYSWVLNMLPTQCSDLSISITGSDGVPPYRVLIVPTGPSPLSKNTEVRSVIDYPFDGNSATASFAINYPANSQFVAVVSDASGFGTGGASVVTQILDSGDSSCFSVSNPYSVPFYYYVGSDNQITQCEPSRIWWDESTVEGTPNFVGIIPGGQSFTIPESNIGSSPQEGTGFSWTASIESGTTLIIAAGDNRGLGAGGWATFTVNFNDNASCLSGVSPSSTPGTPAGIYSTSTAVSISSASSGNPINSKIPSSTPGIPAGTYSSSTAASGNSASSGSNGSTAPHGTKTATLIGGIVGGVAGSLLLVVGILAYLLWRRSSRRYQGPPLDLLGDPPTIEGMTEPYGHTTNRHPSGSAYSSIPRPDSGPSGPTSMASSSDGHGRALIQHRDSGFTLLPPAEEIMVELPPLYSIGVPS